MGSSAVAAQGLCLLPSTLQHQQRSHKGHRNTGYGDQMRGSAANLPTEQASQQSTAQWCQGNQQVDGLEHQRVIP
jgi:hypothetical protein